MEMIQVAAHIVSPLVLPQAHIVGLGLDKILQCRDDCIPTGVHHNGAVLLVVAAAPRAHSAVKGAVILTVRAAVHAEHLVSLDIHDHLGPVKHAGTHGDGEQAVMDGSGMVEQLHIGGRRRVQNARLIPIGVNDHIGRISPTTPGVTQDGVAVGGETAVPLRGEEH